MLYQLSYSPTWRNGAGDETRTRDSQHGKLVLYQLSYSRIGRFIDSLVNANATCCVYRVYTDPGIHMHKIFAFYSLYNIFVALILLFTPETPCGIILKWYSAWCLGLMSLAVLTLALHRWAVAILGDNLTRDEDDGGPAQI